MIYKNKIVSIYEDDVIVKGKQTKIIKIHEKRGAVIIPILPNGKVVMENVYRPAIKKRIYELPAGHIERGESAIIAAKRELKEETGYSVKSIKEMYTEIINPGSMICSNTFFVARLGRVGKRALEEHEDIMVETFDLEEVLEMIRTGKIKDSKTISGILYYVMFG